MHGGDLVQRLPKAELHLHIEGTLEPEMLFALASRNGLTLRYDSIDALRAAYEFEDLEAFLRVYYEGSRVLRTQSDFHTLTRAYLERAHTQNVRHVELFFDPQAHTGRGVELGTVLRGIGGALETARRDFGMTTGLILCFLRHLGVEEARATLEAALPYRDQLLGVGLDSTEVGHPPRDFAPVFEFAREQGLRVVAHAGEEGPPEYIWEALDLLGAERIDHGIRALEDPALLARLSRDRIPLTVCPLSNVRLGIFDRLEQHNLKRLMEAGVQVSVHSDDPAYFGGYLNENLRGVRDALGLEPSELTQLAESSFRAAFLDEPTRARYIEEVREVAQTYRASPQP